MNTTPNSDERGTVCPARGRPAWPGRAGRLLIPVALLVAGLVALMDWPSERIAPPIAPKPPPPQAPDGPPPPTGFSVAGASSEGFRVALPGAVTPEWRVRKAVNSDGTVKADPASGHWLFRAVGGDGVAAEAYAVRTTARIAYDALWAELARVDPFVSSPSLNIESKGPATLGGRPALEVQVVENANWMYEHHPNEVAKPDEHAVASLQKKAKRWVYTVAADDRRVYVVRLERAGAYPDPGVTATVTGSFDFLRQSQPVQRRSKVSRDSTTALTLALVAFPSPVVAQSADWTSGVWHEPQVRYLLADMTLSGKTDTYRKYATEERDPDSREAVRLWDAGARVANPAAFERKWLPNKYGKDGKVMRVVFRGTARTITGDEVMLTTDRLVDSARVRLVVLALTLGRPAAEAAIAGDAVAAEALRRWGAGDRAVNVDQFEAAGGRPVYRGTRAAADGSRVVLESDAPYSERNVRYFLADIALGGSVEFYRGTAEAAHEVSCLEAVRRADEGYRVTNLDEFERKTVGGKVVIVRKGTDARISGRDVRLSSD
jgi:hypothetical protein